MSDFDAVDFFTDESIHDDPYPYFESLRSRGSVQPTPHHGVVAVTGYEEAVAIYRDNESFSACNVVGGPFVKLPVPLEGDDISGILESYRDHIPQNDHLVTMDPPMHTRERALMMRLFTPKRLKESESFMWGLADRQLDEFIDAGHCEFVSAYAQPFSMLVIANLLGVPEEDHRRFREGFGMSETHGYGPSDNDGEMNTLSWLYEWFAGYIEDRRRQPKRDVLTLLAEAKYPDGSTPDVMTVAHQAAILFASGLETTARLLSSAVIYLAELPELQDELRAGPEHISDFVEECLRMESPIKTDFRMVKRTTSLGGIELAAGTAVALFLGAANRDPGRFECPEQFRVGRPNAREHLAFGRGIHSCPGGPLAREEARISVERVLSRTLQISLSDEHHGPPGARRFGYEPTWLLRAPHEVHLEFTPTGGARR